MKRRCKLELITVQMSLQSPKSDIEDQVKINSVKYTRPIMVTFEKKL
jgi:hypothetical protein